MEQTKNKKLPSDPYLRRKQATDRIRDEMTFCHEHGKVDEYDIEGKAFEYATMYATSEAYIKKYAYKLKETLKKGGINDEDKTDKKTTE